jgi:hypothetical protein
VTTRGDLLDTRGQDRFESMLVKLTERERATILAALRRWLSYPAAREADPTATNRGKHKPLDDGEIQRLCKRISEMGARGNAASLRRHSNNGARAQSKDEPQLLLDQRSAAIHASGLQRPSRPARG